MREDQIGINRSFKLLEHIFDFGYLGREVTASECVGLDTRCVRSTQEQP